MSSTGHPAFSVGSQRDHASDPLSEGLKALPDRGPEVDPVWTEAVPRVDRAPL
jgi:hypothetical protein